MLYTRTGDGGMTGLFGTKERVPKDHPVFEALGSVDELNALIGLAQAYLRGQEQSRGADALRRVQEVLFVVQAELAGADKHVTRAHLDALEAGIGDIELSIEKPTSFLVPGATVSSALFDYLRTVSRRVERAALRAHAGERLSLESRAYLNRLSSFFYALARYAAQAAHVTEASPTYDLAT